MPILFYEDEIYVGRKRHSYYLFSFKPEWIEGEEVFDPPGTLLLKNEDEDVNLIPKTCRGLRGGEIRKVRITCDS